MSGLPHHADRTAAGIARSFADAGRDDLPSGMAEALAARIAAAGSWSAAYSAVYGKGAFSGWSDEDRWLAAIPVAEADADNPSTALASLLSVLPMPDSVVHPDTRERNFVRAARLLARINGTTVEAARDTLNAWVAESADDFDALAERAA